jgi:hypothetical protein
MGALIGTLIAAATYLPLDVDPSRWMLLLSGTFVFFIHLF